MLGIEWLDGGTLTVIVGALGSIAGAIGAVVKWSHKQFVGLISWGKPLAEGVVQEHRQLIQTLSSKQVETTEHIGAIRGRVDSINETLNVHTGKLKRIEDHTCPTGPIGVTGPKP